MQEGPFIITVLKQSIVSSWFPFRKLGSENALSAKFDDVYSRLQNAYRNYLPDALPHIVAFNLSGGFGIALQNEQETAGGIYRRKQPAIFTYKKAAIIMHGFLTNAAELVLELFQGRCSDLSSSFGSDSETHQFQSEGDQATLSAEVILQMYLRTANDAERLPLLLSELQGQYSFVIYDSSKKQIFAARDPNGIECLFYNFDEEGYISFSNNDNVFSSNIRGSWHEVPPGHFCGGKNSKHLQQFALTPNQLRMRDCVDNLHDFSVSLQSTHDLSTPRTKLFTEEGSAITDEIHSVENNTCNDLFRISV